MSACLRANVRSLVIADLPAEPSAPLHFVQGRDSAVGAPLTLPMRSPGHEVVDSYMRSADSQVAMRTRFVGAFVKRRDQSLEKALAMEECLGKIRGTLTGVGGDFDVWPNEKALRASGEVANSRAVLEEGEFVDIRRERQGLNGGF